LQIRVTAPAPTEPLARSARHSPEGAPPYASTPSSTP
jgi:hypothetical protein